MSIEKLVDVARKARFLNVEPVPLDESIVRAVLLAMREDTMEFTDHENVIAQLLLKHVTPDDIWKKMLDHYLKDQNNV